MSESIWFLDTLIRIHVDAESSRGAYDLVECLAPRGHQPPPHVHDTHSEHFFVVEGELTVRTAAGETVLGTGDALLTPAGEPHTFEVTSSGPARFIVSSAPGAFAAFVREFGTRAQADVLPTLFGPPDVDRLIAVAGDHGIRFVDSLAPAQPATA